MQRAGVLVTQHTLLQVDVVFTCLRVISNSIVKMGNLRAFTESFTTGDNIPYRKWLRKQPSLLTDTWGGAQVRQSTGVDRSIWCLALFGECFWYVLSRDRLAYPDALEVLHPAFMEIKADPLTGEPIYLYGTGTNKRLLDPEDVVHIFHKSLPSGLRALSPVEYVGVSGALAMAAYEFGSTWFSQGASPDFILSTDRKLGQEEVARIANKFVIEHAGLSTSHMPLVLDNGLKAEKVMASPDEAQYLNTLEYARSVIFSWFGCEFLNTNALQRVAPPPPGGMQEESMRFLQYTLSGYMVPYEEAVSSLLPDGVMAAFDDHKLVRPNAAAMAELVTSLRQGQIATQNEIRAKYFGWAPLPGGDELVAPLASNTAPSQTQGDTGNPQDQEDQQDPPGTGGS